MKIEDRQVKAAYLAGLSEWAVRLFAQYVLHYDPLWIQMMGALGTGMILYGSALQLQIIKQKGGIKQWLMKRK